MPVFKDAEGRDWIVRIDVNALRRVRDRLGLNLMDLIGGETLDRVSKDPVLLVDVLYVLCEVEIKERAATPEDFARGLTGDALDAAVTALLEALADFCPSRKRQLLRQVLAKGKAFEDRVLETAEQRIASGEIERAMETSTSGNSSTGSPASAESTPAP